MTGRIVESSTSLYKPAVTVDLSGLKAVVAALEATHPLHSVVFNLPKQMPTADFTALVPVMWQLTGRP